MSIYTARSPLRKAIWKLDNRGQPERDLRAPDQSPVIVGPSGVAGIAASAVDKHDTFGDTMAGGSSRSEFRSRTLNLELLVFDGTNPDGWVFRAECYFALNHFSDSKKLYAAVISFDGAALAWYQ
ncbi:hypothetical protein TorRG33x02_275890 [Trema orientale]|uniref:Uncharacterized protein n=1 Tax=Trema orientale TaxID=63057 RepID=A0A2P5CRC6_TREOI|nr:hypothetical protein TorRG33x02_275890 [Trema orientale]